MVDSREIKEFKLGVPGESPERPFVIFALFLDRTVGDFAGQNVFAASVKRLFRYAKLFCYYRNDRPYKTDIIFMNPYIDRAIVGSDPNVGLLSDYFDQSWQPPFSLSMPIWVENGMSRPDLLLTPSMMDLSCIQTFPNIGYLSITGDRAARDQQRLVDLGLDPNRWFCCIHYREITYEFRAYHSARNVSHVPFQDVTNFIIDKLGGQVVRLGHVGMQAFQQRPGLIDLTLVADSFSVQAFAFSRAKFNLASCSGMNALSAMLGTPIARVDVVDLGDVNNDHDIVLLQHLFDANGRRVPLDEALELGLYHTNSEGHLRPGYRFMENTSAELMRCAKIMYDSTQDCPAWREHVVSHVENPVGSFSIPRERKSLYRIVDFPDLAPT